MKSQPFTKALVASAMALSLTLGACATTPDTRMTEGKGLAAAWASLDAVAVTIDGLATTRVLHGQKAAEASRELTQASAALTAADAAYRNGDNATAQQNVASATALIAALLLITQGPN